MKLGTASLFVFGVILELVVGAVTLAIMAAGERAARK